MEGNMSVREAVAKYEAGGDPLALAGEIAALDPRLAGQQLRIQGLLTLCAAGTPVVEVMEAETQAENLERRAQAAILAHPMLSSSQAAVALGAKASNREKVRSYRDRSELVAIPVGRNRYRYPAFQFDREKARLYPEVVTVNQLLNAARDPWGVASWWISEDGYLGCAPYELVGRDPDRVIDAAKGLLDP